MLVKHHSKIYANNKYVMLKVACNDEVKSNEKHFYDWFFVVNEELIFKKKID